ncbi:Hypothetical predicted protein [Scomber scombrus]|uniref:Uncharacterized protein n=1 Tax=Scomber scombrus TaxID=13677 RepID=A0AAV1Q2Z4_SCOSC
MDAQLTGKTDRQELANHKKVAQFLPSNRLLRAAKVLRLLRRCENLLGKNSLNAAEFGF